MLEGGEGEGRVREREGGGSERERKRRWGEGGGGNTQLMLHAVIDGLLSTVSPYNIFVCPPPSPQ